MSTLQLFNTLSREKEEFKSLEPGVAGLYACGLTVYNHGHIGNFRTFVYVDLLRRALQLFGYRVRHVMNFTDVDDKTIRGAKEAGIPLRDYTSKFIEIFKQDAQVLNLQLPHEMPRATDSIPEIVALISKLVANGSAYQAGDGSVYFRVSSFKCYGCLAHLDLEGLVAGARVSQDEYAKESYGDFALWKAWSTDDGDVGWESPWGKGRPGWHIECSAMSMRALGETFDIHCGGVDLMFPHHENEIAQSEAATGKKFVRYWGHSDHLLVENEKMSKSAGNFYTVPQILEKNYTGRELRYVLMGTYYRKQLNFTWDGMEAAKTALTRIDEWKARWKGMAAGPAEGPEAMAFVQRFRDVLGDDLNISGALGELFDFIRETNKAFDAGKTIGGLEAAWVTVDSVLGLGDRKEEVPAEIQVLLDTRKQARQDKNFAQSDVLRQQLDAAGWLVKDTPKGQELRRK